ncbi:MAG: glycosyltransferase family 2 protein [Bacteroidota bacterium]|nr:glycosyltransferase family 2 protein [Bacteroidota bacterium]
MKIVEIIFWVLAAIVCYTYVGYGILLFVLVRIKRKFRPRPQTPRDPDYVPEVTLFIAAYNEKDWVAQKMHNTRSLNYPKNKLRVMWVTDGSDDGTPELLAHYPEATVLHLPERNGKIGAMNRGMKYVHSRLVVFSDANTMLSTDSIQRIVDQFRDPGVGCVSGEKRIQQKESDTAAASGEGLYWKYESTLKKWDAELYSVVGAAGELFALRTELFREVESDTLLDDFIISLRIAQMGYRIQYDPEAYAMESSSLNVKEELKRKIRISAGGIQSVVRLRAMLNVFKYGTLSFQYISHRVLRWTLTPLSLLLLLPLGFFLAYHEGIWGWGLYSVIFWLQVLVYGMAIAGYILENRETRLKILFVPYYFFIMNLSVLLGFNRYLKGQQSVNWERARRG